MLLAEARFRADALIRRHFFNPTIPTAEEVSRLLQELEDQRVELERQNQELRMAQQEIELSRDRYADLYDFAPVGYITLDRNSRIVELNLVAAEMLGIPRGYAAGQNFVNFATDSDKDKLIDHLAGCFAGRQESTCEIEFLPHVGSRAVLQLISVAFKGGDAETFCRTAMMDVSDHRRARNELAEAKRAAEAANIAKSQFLANMSHELRTPMSAIIGMTELALEEQLPPVAKEYLQTSKRAADSLLYLLNQILDLSRVDAGRMEIESIPFCLREVLVETLKTLRATAEDKGLCVTCETSKDVPDWLLGDPLRLRQVLTNLLGNSIKFSRHGIVAVRASLRKRSDDQTVLEFAVADTGIGIAEKDLKRLFAPFTQVDASMPRQFGGTGLGLSIAASLVRTMGGHIWAESTLGLGSTFFFTLPCKPTAAPTEFPATEKPSAGLAATPVRRLRVLLVEDTPTNQKLVRTILVKRGHEVAVADNGEVALNRLRERDYDVVLMDVQMPVMNGFEATSAIRHLPNVFKSQVPIIAMTAHAMRGDHERCLAAGMDAYLAKPIDRAQLIQFVERLARSEAE